jgi:hypothetical protein
LGGVGDAAAALVDAALAAESVAVAVSALSAKKMSLGYGGTLVELPVEEAVSSVSSVSSESVEVAVESSVIDIKQGWHWELVS